MHKLQPRRYIAPRSVTKLMISCYRRISCAKLHTYFERVPAPSTQRVFERLDGRTVIKPIISCVRNSSQRSFTFGTFGSMPSHSMGLCRRHHSHGQFFYSWSIQSIKSSDQNRVMPDSPSPKIHLDFYVISIGIPCRPSEKTVPNLTSYPA